MIILDENLLGLRLDIPIARWYAGRVCYLTVGDNRIHRRTWSN